MQKTNKQNKLKQCKKQTYNTRQKTKTMQKNKQNKTKLKQCKNKQTKLN